MRLRLVLLIAVAFAAVALTPALDDLAPAGSAEAKPCVIGPHSWCVIEDHCMDPPRRWVCY